MSDLFSQPDFASYHGKENNSFSEKLYEENMKELNGNSLVILDALLDGKKVSGRDCQMGLLDKRTGKIKYMSEYRKRFDEIKRWLTCEFGFSLHIESVDRSNVWYMEEKEIVRVKNRYGIENL